MPNLPEVSFYQLTANSRYQRLELACRLAETIFKRGKTLMISCCNQEQAEELSKLLWSFSPSSFLPHQLANQTTERLAAITLTWPEIKPAAEHQVLLNLTLETPQNFTAFSRIAEIMDSEEEVLSAKRKTWQFYKNQGCKLELHKI